MRNPDRAVLIGLVILVVILIVGYWAYERCYLDAYLAPKHQKCKLALPIGGLGGSPFVGAMGQHPRLVPCAFPTSPDWQWNRCNAM